VSVPPSIITRMEVTQVEGDIAPVDEAIAWLEKANASLEPELLPVHVCRERLQAYARAEKLHAFGVAALASRIEDPSEVAKATGTSVGKARDAVATGEVLRVSGELERGPPRRRGLP
jgi:hypothetical protein